MKKAVIAAGILLAASVMMTGCSSTKQESATAPAPAPAASIQTIETIEKSDIKLVQNEEVINLRGTVIPLIRLNEVIGTESHPIDENSLIAVIVKKGDKMAGLVIDELIGQQEIVIKSIGKFIKQSKMISGATILGDGEVALILDANALI